jgi:hypothetical protein
MNCENGAGERGRINFSGSVSNCGNTPLTNVVVLNNQPANNTPVTNFTRLEVGEITDRNFLQEYYQQEWEEQKDQVTRFNLRHLRDNASLEFSVSGLVDPFFMQTQNLPRLDHYWLGQSLLDDTLTWYEHSNVAYLRQNLGYTGLIDWPTAFWQPEAAAWLSLVAYARHVFTDYDALLQEHYDQESARFFVAAELAEHALADQLVNPVAEVRLRNLLEQPICGERVVPAAADVRHQARMTGGERLQFAEEPGPDRGHQALARCAAHAVLR